MPKAAVTTAAWTGMRSAGRLTRREVFSMRPITMGGIIRMGPGNTILVSAVSLMATGNKERGKLERVVSRKGNEVVVNQPFVAASVEFAR